MPDKKSIDTLVKDIYKLFDEGNDRKPTPHDLNKFTREYEDLCSYLSNRKTIW